MISSSLNSPQAESAKPDIDPEKALAALGNKLRWQIFQMMADGTPMHAAQVARHFDRDFDGISKHLRLMRAAGLLHSRRATDRRVEQYFIPPSFRIQAGQVDLGFCLLRIPGAAPEAPMSPTTLSEAAEPTALPIPAPVPNPPPVPTLAETPDPPHLEDTSDEEDGEETPVQGFGEMLASSTLMGSDLPGEGN